MLLRFAYEVSSPLAPSAACLASQASHSFLSRLRFFWLGPAMRTVSPSHVIGFRAVSVHTNPWGPAAGSSGGSRGSPARRGVAAARVSLSPWSMLLAPRSMRKVSGSPAHSRSRLWAVAPAITSRTRPARSASTIWLNVLCQSSPMGSVHASSRFGPASPSKKSSSPCAWSSSMWLSTTWSSWPPAAPDALEFGGQVVVEDASGAAIDQHVVGLAGAVDKDEAVAFFGLHDPKLEHRMTPLAAKVWSAGDPENDTTRRAGSRFRGGAAARSARCAPTRTVTARIILPTCSSLRRGVLHGRSGRAP